MKIAIDTKEDSLEDIKKVIRMLQHLVGEGGEFFETKEAGEGELKEGIFNMFSDSPKAGTTESGTQASEQEKGTFDVDEFIDEKKDEDDEPKVIPY